MILSTNQISRWAWIRVMRFPGPKWAYFMPSLLKTDELSFDKALSRTLRWLKTSNIEWLTGAWRQSRITMTWRDVSRFLPLKRAYFDPCTSTLYPFSGKWGLRFQVSAWSIASHFYDCGISRDIPLFIIISAIEKESFTLLCLWRKRKLNRMIRRGNKPNHHTRIIVVID